MVHLSDAQVRYDEISGFIRFVGKVEPFLDLNEILRPKLCEEHFGRHVNEAAMHVWPKPRVFEVRVHSRKG
jgi:hypothetical protein